MWLGASPRNTAVRAVDDPQRHLVVTTDGTSRSKRLHIEAELMPRCRPERPPKLPQKARR